MTTARPRPAPRSGVPTEQQDQAAQPATRPAAPASGPRATPSPATGAQSLVRSLEEVGCDVVFGIPGGAILPAYDPLMTPRGSGTSWSATSRARATPPPATRRPPARSGVCMATSGPGATNLVTPIADAHMDSVPIVAITGQVGRSAHRHRRLPGSRHLRHHACRSPSTTSWSPTPTDIPRAIAEAFHIASTGRPGPVLVDIPKDVLQAQTTFTWPPELRPARLPADHPAARQADPRGRQADQRGAAPGALRRRRRHQGRGHRRAAEPRRADRRARRHHADGARRVPRQPPASTWACRACTARSPRSPRCRRPTCSSPSAPASTTASPASWTASPRTPRSSTPTSTRPRSARTGRRTCRSSATPARSSPS